MSSGLSAGLLQLLLLVPPDGAEVCDGKHGSDPGSSRR